MSTEDLQKRLAHLKEVRMHSMEKRASIVCGDGIFDESSDYLKICLLYTSDAADE